MRISDQSIDRIYCNIFTRNAGYIMEGHSHYYYELFYIKQGTCKLFLQDQFYNLAPGDFLLIPPHEIHYSHYTVQTTRYNIYFYQNDLIESKVLTPDTIAFRLSPGVWHTPGAHRSTIESVLDSMVLDENIDDDLTKELQRLKLSQFLLYCMRCCIRKENDITLNTDSAIESATKYIAAHFNQSITLTQLAKKAGLSPAYFSKKFRKATGMGLKEYIIYIRLKNAALELKSTRHSITDVALNCGFNDSNYFKDAFKKMYGMPPREYRKSFSTDLLLQESIKNS